MRAPIAIIMGSQSDWETMRHAADLLDELGLACEKLIVSAHRTPERLFAFAKGAKAAGLKIIIAGAERGTVSSSLALVGSEILLYHVLGNPNQDAYRLYRLGR